MHADDKTTTAQVLSARYERIAVQLADLCRKVDNPLSRMATLVALVHSKMPHFFWTGFYLLEGGSLLVGPYQGSLACLQLAKGEGVCWACIERQASLIVPDVHAFPGHIACDSRSRSEIVVPLWEGRQLRGVLDVDAEMPEAFSAVDQHGLEELVKLIYPVSGA